MAHNLAHKQQLAQVVWVADSPSGASGAVTAAAVSPDQRWAASATADGVCVRQLGSGSEVCCHGAGRFQSVVWLGDAVVGAGEQGLFRFSLASGSAAAPPEELCSTAASCLAQRRGGGGDRTVFAIGRCVGPLAPCSELGRF